MRPSWPSWHNATHLEVWCHKHKLWAWIALDWLVILFKQPEQDFKRLCYKMVTNPNSYNPYHWCDRDSSPITVPHHMRGKDFRLTFWSYWHTYGGNAESTLVIPATFVHILVNWRDQVLGLEVFNLGFNHEAYQLQKGVFQLEQHWQQLKLCFSMSTSILTCK